MVEPIFLKDHIEYSSGSVVSKTLKQNPAGTITLFAFDAGQGLSEHSAPFDAPRTCLLLSRESGSSKCF